MRSARLWLAGIRSEPRAQICCWQALPPAIGPSRSGSAVDGRDSMFRLNSSSPTTGHVQEDKRSGRVCMYLCGCARVHRICVLTLCVRIMYGTYLPTLPPPMGLVGPACLSCRARPPSPSL